MRRTTAIIVTVAALTALAMSGCGEDKVERGITTTQPEAVPMNSAEMDETERARREEVAEELMAEAQKHFDAAEKKEAAENQEAAGQ
jgi:urease gamma subunit